MKNSRVINAIAYSILDSLSPTAGIPFKRFGYPMPAVRKAAINGV
jgi:hypothetical protein